MYAEFYQYDRHYEEGKGWTTSEKLVPGVGDRAALKIDGRNHINTVHDIAMHACKTRGYAAYRLFKGSVRKPDYITDLIPITEPPTPDTDTGEH